MCNHSYNAVLCDPLVYLWVLVAITAIVATNIQGYIWGILEHIFYETFELKTVFILPRVQTLALPLLHNLVNFKISFLIYCSP